MTIDQVRDIFGATPDLAARLRSEAAERFAPPQRPATFLDKLGPLFRRAPATDVDPSRPLASDVDALLAGGFIPPERRGQCWEVLDAWLASLAHADERLDIPDLDALEYDLGFQGLPSQFSLRQLWTRDLGIPLPPPAGGFSGYAKHGHVVATRDALRGVLEATPDELTAQTRQICVLVVTLLDLIAAHPQQPMDLIAYAAPVVAH